MEGSDLEKIERAAPVNGSPRMFAQDKAVQLQNDFFATRTAKGGLGYGHRQTIELQNAFREKLTLAKKVEDAFCMKKNK